MLMVCGSCPARTLSWTQNGRDVVVSERKTVLLEPDLSAASQILTHLAGDVAAKFDLDKKKSLHVPLGDALRLFLFTDRLSAGQLSSVLNDHVVFVFLHASYGAVETCTIRVPSHVNASPACAPFHGSVVRNGMQVLHVVFALTARANRAVVRW